MPHQKQQRQIETSRAPPVLFPSLRYCLQSYPGVEKCSHVPQTSPSQTKAEADRRAQTQTSDRADALERVI